LDSLAFVISAKFSSTAGRGALSEVPALSGSTDGTGSGAQFYDPEAGYSFLAPI